MDSQRNISFHNTKTNDIFVMDQNIWKRLEPLTRSINPNEMVVSEKECWAILGRKKSKTVKALSPVYKTKQKL